MSSLHKVYTQFASLSCSFESSVCMCCSLKRRACGHTRHTPRPVTLLKSKHVPNFRTIMWAVKLMNIPEKRLVLVR